MGVPGGVGTFDISGPEGEIIGTAYAFKSYQQILYITFQFTCSYALSTDPG